MQSGDDYLMPVLTAKLSLNYFICICKFPAQLRLANVTIVSAIKNLQRVRQKYLYIVEVLDSRRVVLEIEMLNGTLAPAQSTTIHCPSQNGEEKQVYTVKVFLLTAGENPELITKFLEAQIPVISE